VVRDRIELSAFRFSGAIEPVGLDYWIWPGRPGGLGSSL